MNKDELKELTEFKNYIQQRADYYNAIEFYNNANDYRTMVKYLQYIIDKTNTENMVK